MNFCPSHPAFLRRPFKARTGLALALLVCALAPLGTLEGQMPRDRMRNRATDQPRAKARTGMDAIQRHFFSPRVVMHLRREISLTEEQRKALIAELQSAQSDLVPLEFEAQEAQEALSRLARENRLDEESVLHQAHRVMDLEAEVRARHLVLLVRIKNLLTPEQQRRIQEIQRRQRANRAPQH